MSESFWQAKVWGLLHDPLLKSLYQQKNANGVWELIINNFSPESVKQIKPADFIAAASDRPAWDSPEDRPGERGKVDYKAHSGLQIHHLLSGQSRTLKFDKLEDVNRQQDQKLKAIEEKIINEKLLPLLQDLPNNEEKYQKAYWWLWRCFPSEIARELGEMSTLLPADTRIPDCSIWSHNSMTSALAGCLSDHKQSRPHLVIFSFAPVQDLIQASRKMQDFWAGSWLLHYLSAQVCWAWAKKFGPDSLVYPCLYSQPLIDLWLKQKYPDFTGIETNSRRLLTAGFPNVLVGILPAVQGEKGNAINIAKNTLQQEWLRLGQKVLDTLPAFEKRAKGWTKEINQDRLWKGWLKEQWQIYWSALPLGDGESSLKKGQGKIITQTTRKTERSQLANLKQEFIQWLNKQNHFCQLDPFPENALNPDLTWNPDAFINQDNYPSLAELYTYESYNVGLWWPKIFDQLRFSLRAVKSHRNWKLPSVFTPRSTISGIGPVLHPQQYQNQQPVDWVGDNITRQFWENAPILFDGQEQLNPTEVLKRSLRYILDQELGLNREELATSYPDLTAGVAGYLKVNQNQEVWDNFQQVQDAIKAQFTWTKSIQGREKWGIPWADAQPQLNNYHPRLLSPRWLVEDAENMEDREILRGQINTLISQYYPQSNPTNWYVLASGDGDDLGKWLNGSKLQSYREYIAEDWAQQSWPGFEKFKDNPKRMGPATHAALSRALLDFSNQLLPYLTEQRYAGRLIYGGGDDVLAYSNLWEWNRWLWDVRQCFQGGNDPLHQFNNSGGYWQWQNGAIPEGLAARPLFTMGDKATISFGVVIAYYSVPMAIALELLEAAKQAAKEHQSPDGTAKDAVQICVIYSNGNILKATAKFNVFDCWQQLLEIIIKRNNATIRGSLSLLLEQVAKLWLQHPSPFSEIKPWLKAVCENREILQKEPDLESDFKTHLEHFLREILRTTPEDEQNKNIQTWLKLAAFLIRQQEIKIKDQTQVLPPP